MKEQIIKDLMEAVHDIAKIKGENEALRSENKFLRELLTKQSNIGATIHWFDCSERLPLCTETGAWDGKKSDLIIGETITGKKFLGCCYEGFIDGSSFFDWYQVDEINHNDWLVNDAIVRWMKIPF